MANYVRQLSEIVGSDSVFNDAATIDATCEDWRGRYRGNALCVVKPRSTADVAAVVRWCSDNTVLIVPQGGNTSLCGGSVPSEDGPATIVLCLERMRRIRSIDTMANSMTVDAGCVLATVHEAAREVGKLYSVSLGAEGSCQIGGTIATNAGGTSVLRYGTTRDQVLGLEMVLPDGTIVDALTSLRKNNTGYDLKQLFIGSEGTLGIITGAVLKLHPLPDRTAVAWLGLEELSTAGKLLAILQAKAGNQLSAFELVNRLQLELVLEHVADRHDPLGQPYPWYLLVELSGGGDLDVDAMLQGTLEAAFESGLVADAVLAASETQRLALWEIRHSVSEANKKGGVGLTTDCAVPISAIQDFIDRADRAVRGIAPSCRSVIVAHLGDGNVHFIPFFDFPTWEAMADRVQIGNAVRHSVNVEAATLGGTFSAEHGIGRVSLGEMSDFKSSADLAVMRAIKNTIDPKGIMNPGRLLPPGKAYPVSTDASSQQGE